MIPQQAWQYLSENAVFLLAMVMVLGGVLQQNRKQAEQLLVKLSDEMKFAREERQKLLDGVEKQMSRVADAMKEAQKETAAQIERHSDRVVKQMERNSEQMFTIFSDMVARDAAPPRDGRGRFTSKATKKEGE